MENLIKKGLLIDIKNLKKNKNNNSKDKELQKKKDYFDLILGHRTLH